MRENLIYVLSGVRAFWFAKKLPTKQEGDACTHYLQIPVANKYT